MPNEIIATTPIPAAANDLWPPPQPDPLDPLRWPRRAKVLALLSTAFFNFAANFAGSGLSVATELLEHQFNKTPHEVNSLLTFNFLLLGVGNMFWVPLSVKYGKRPIMLISMLTLFIVLVWTAKATSFNQLLVARCLSGFFSAAGESIVPGVVSDIFFMHERGIMMSIYVMFIVCGTAIGPLIGGFVVSYSSGTWRTFSWVCAALAGFCFLAMFFLFPESSYTRPVADRPPSEDADADSASDRKDAAATAALADAAHNTVPLRYADVWRQGFHVNPLVSLPRAFVMPFMFLGNMPVLWTVLVYATNLSAQIIIIFALPSFLSAPPYLWPSSSIGLMQVAAVVGFSVACYGGGYLCDKITARVIARHNGRFVPEYRLISMVPGCWVAPTGCILIAFACAHKLSWVAVAFGFGMISFGTIYSPNIAMTYLLDSYLAFSQEILVVVNVFKNMVAFLFLYVAVNWINAQGWIQVYMVMFMMVTLAALAAVPIYMYGGRIRTAYERVILRAAGSVL